MIVPDEVVIAALMKDAKKFKSKWELNTNEPTRSKPNVVFLKRTLNNVVKVNKDRMRKTRNIENYERQIKMSSTETKNEESPLEESYEEKKRSRSRRDSPQRSKSKSCSKSKYRSPERRNRTRKSSKRKRKSKSRHSD